MFYCTVFSHVQISDTCKCTITVIVPNIGTDRLEQKVLTRSGPDVIKFFFMLNSVEHEILNAHKHKKYPEICFFF